MESSQVQQWVTVAGRWVARGALGVAVLAFVIQWLLPRLRKACRGQLTPRPQGQDPGDDAEGRADRRKRQEMLQDLQDKHRAKAAVYRERVLAPREEARRLQREAEHRHFLGPAWKGPGQALGTDDSHQSQQETLDVFEQDLNPGEMAALRRRIQEPTPQPPQPPQKPKRVIVLPEQPAEGDGESVVVILRSPIHTTYQRRFRQTDTVQTLLDFMVVSGFSATFNTLSTTFPRHDLAKQRDATLQDLGFGRRVTLNIEELELG